MTDLPKLYDMSDIAGMLKVSKRWLQYHLQGRSIGRIVGRKRMFTQEDAQQIVDELPRVEPVRLAGRVSPSPGKSVSASQFISELKQRSRRQADAKRRETLDEALRLANEKPVRRPRRP